MGRTQTFDTADVVRSARAVFWEHGFEGASLPELERVTGLSRSSIYHAFGSKRGLFDAAVESYLTEVTRPRLAPLTVETPAPDALRQYLRGLQSALSGPALRASAGCLLLNAAATPIGQDAAVSAVVAGYRAEIAAAIRNGVRAMSPTRSDAEQRLLADTCTGLVIAAFALARVAPADAAAVLDTALTQLSPARA